MDIYLPAGESEGPRPVCLYIHGGGWQGGDKAEGEIFLRGPVQAGWVGISTNYRLSGQAKWPAQIEDVHACLEWIGRHADEIGADPERIVVAGGSAGGHLSLMAGLDQHSWRNYSIIGTFSLYGPTDLLAEEWHFHQIRYMLVNLLGGDPLEDPSQARDASPLNYADKRDVPVFMVHGDADDIVPYSQSVAMQELLSGLGVDNRLLRVPGGNHGNFDETDPDWTEIAREFLQWSNQLAGIEEIVEAEEAATVEN
ncbi:MAG: alpha/beta hydrolase [Planctomycetales bacterium]|nr:alpha/beta hydrolase [bacterium]UNM07336.1 MAG: alpha/beta hydrolase [Planctomycetales bacterium]